MCRVMFARLCIRLSLVDYTPRCQSNRTLNEQIRLSGHQSSATCLVVIVSH